MEIVLVHRLPVNRVLRFRQRGTQLGLQRIEALLGAHQHTLFGRVHMHHQEQRPAQVIEDHHFLGSHQQDIGHAQHILTGRRSQARLEVAHAVVTEVTHQATVETG